MNEWLLDSLRRPYCFGAFNVEGNCRQQLGDADIERFCSA